MMFSDYVIQPYGDKAILIKWSVAPSKELRTYLTLAKEALREVFDREVILAYQELLIKNIESSDYQIHRVGKCLREINSTHHPESRRTIRIPVCYNLQFGTDIETFAKAKNISIEDIIKLHTAPEYIVYFLGFLPGFPYLMGMDKQLYMPRKDIPSRKIVSGSVAIGGEQTGLYRQESPGGWHVIGHCPIPLFDVHFTKYSLFQSGDYVQFESITVQEHGRLSKMSLPEFINSSFVSRG